MNQITPFFETDFPAAMRPGAPRDAAFSAMSSIGLQLRVQSMRVCMLGFTAALSNDHDHVLSIIAGAERAAVTYRLYVELLKDDGRTDQLNEEAVLWMRAVNPKRHDAIKVFTQMDRIQMDMIAKIKGADDCLVEADIKGLLRYGYDHFSPAAFAIDETVRRAHDALLMKEAEAAREARLKAEEAMTRVADISKMIRLIAFNASVEANRAGEAGAGFGVIAQEIRRLSEETAEASGDIQRSLDGIMNIVETR